ncbi:MAG: type III-A CRISPR-associated RAMP protein Csm5 [Syntrophus sp. (in: bacteria)]|nr:type III-A CRISPR-associated RAMP protein Csm5 [Syntrophus sp. (in: bacteria)]
MIEERKFAIRILAPVHIGCDEVYDPTGFVIDEGASMLHAFDPIDFFKSLPQQDKDRLAAICAKGSIESIIELYKFMKGRRFDGHRTSICGGFLDNYRKTLSIPVNDRRRIQQELNNFTIARTAFNPTTHIPYIPGSAVKGALRTAYLNGRQSLKKLPRDKYSALRARGANQLEQDLLDGGSFASDPFRLLKVSDFHPLGPCRTKIVYAVNEKKKPSQFPACGHPQTLEVIEPGSVFVGTIQVLQPLAREVIKTPLTEQSLFESAGFFYGREKAREDAELSEADLPCLQMDDLAGALPLRIGRHSGSESLTIEGQRNIRIMQGGGRPATWSSKGATTFWMAAESSSGYRKSALRPFGWAALGELSAEMAARIENQNDVKTTELAPIGHEAEPAALQKPVPATPPAPVEEIWADAYVGFDAGGGGILRAIAKDGSKKAELRGREKALAVSAEPLHKKLFEGKKSVPKASVTVRKISEKIHEIVRVDVAAS